MKIAVIAVQGAFREHIAALKSLGVEAYEAKWARDLEGADGVIIPGGESTAIGKLMREYDMLEPVRALARAGKPIYGTCAGMIVLAKRIEGEDTVHLGLMDVTVRRNSFGRQRESFEAEIDIPAIGAPPFPAVFIRAPHIVSVGEGVEVLATYEDRIVAVRQGNLLATSFHPELTDDYRLHQYFLNMAQAPVAH
ncbi:pyridoxal 5'-phosphate synthase glutaminase subunit PdxT [Alicyclobacillus acidocaldarius]|uniref:Pyridoxal 5'-phosphate synthase subunit PdxT n=1 Tax=Alicyclobacillus acidocaldarius subsp. acidocaldarius (strain ATCC 27009 / DSM 446 / BCRC 14685 / JCM 5260 / KCTC 1825 / NBRC 15652 / NCIMB 11725 / NRRL B-14509 / 104-IA) TaxID=521098 RepID=C8WPX4_ALIAD|nr:pyridoxal 5'-phosphate synthase glutaminase subunit PdxT [Alicyclobacillus acidocaldarius]ACV57078.1 SNO glutamine amidotransferase [Alicyclobacillus acidocaldarius subsp. acidocaldarius DSM 446]